MPLEVLVKPFPRFPIAPGSKNLAPGFQIALSLSSGPTTASAATSDKEKVSSGLSKEAYAVAVALSHIKVKSPSSLTAFLAGAGPAFAPVLLLGLPAAFALSAPVSLPVPLGFRPLDSMSAGSLVSSALFPSHSLPAAAGASAVAPGVPLAGWHSAIPAGEAATQVTVGKKRGWPPEDPAELSLNPRS